MRIPRSWPCWWQHPLGRRMLVACAMVSASTTAAYGLDPTRALSQFVSDEWGVERGFVGGVVRAIAETPDGYLWLGTDRGLVRFDGATFTLVAESDVSAAGAAVLDLAVDGNGDLWIRRRSPDVQRLSKGRFEDALFSLSPKEEFVMALARGRNGTVLLAARTHGIARHAGQGFETLTPLSAEERVRAMVEAPDGRVWLGTEGSGLFSVLDGRVARGPDDLARETIDALSPAADRGLWIGTQRGLRWWNGHDGKTEAVPAALSSLHVVCILQDRDANVWPGTTEGLGRIGPDGSVVFDRDAARVRGAVTALFEDREGSLWVGGATGIARLRQSGFTAYARAEGLPADRTGPVHVDAGGRIWFAPVQGGLYWLQQRRVERVTAAGLDRDVVYAIAGGGDDVWVGRKHGGLTRLRVAGDTVYATTFTARDGLAPGSIVALHRSRDGAIWAGTDGAGASVSRANGAGFTTYTVASGLASNIISSIGETRDGTVWAATPQGLSAFAGGRWRTYRDDDGLPPGAINCVLGAGADASLWAGTTAGLVRIVEGRVVGGNPPSVLRDQIVGLAEDNRGSLWVATSTRILQVALDPLRRWALSESDIREFEKADGLRSVETTRRERALIQAPDGRIWLSTTGGLAVIDPARLSPRLPAIAGVRAISVDGVALDLSGAVPLHIPSTRERIAFELLGVSLSFPHQVRLRYRLDGSDRDWSPATTATEAIYTHLAPGPYRFRVMSSTGDGRWRESDASVALVVEPAFWQTSWFRLFVVATFGGLAGAAWRLRTRQLTRQLNVRFEERLAERTRIARELHDTLLQSFQGLMLRFQSARDLLSANPAKAGEALDGALERADQAIAEGRDAIQNLRSSTAVGNELSQAITSLVEELTNGNRDKGSATFSMSVEGSPRDLHPIVRDDIHRIAREALRNAFRHAQADRIEAEVTYGARELRLRIRDDGKGIDPQHLSGGRVRHWGLAGMRERAVQIGAQLNLWSEVGAGTEVELRIPGGVAYSAHRREGSGS